MSSTNYCTEQLMKEYQAYNGIASFSVSLTLLLMLVRVRCSEQLLQKPTTAYRTLFGCAALKFVLGMILVTVYWPTCPDGCVCNIAKSYTYPILVFGLAILWAVRGKAYLDLSKQSTVTLPSVVVQNTEMT